MLRKVRCSIIPWRRRSALWLLSSQTVGIPLDILHRVVEKEARVIDRGLERERVLLTIYDNRDAPSCNSVEEPTALARVAFWRQAKDRIEHVIGVTARCAELCLRHMLALTA